MGVRDKTRAVAALARLSPRARRMWRSRLTYLSTVRLLALERCVADVKRRGIPGDFVETGLALGGSGIVLASHLDEGREFHGYDVFGMIPPPGEQDDARSHERYEQIASGAATGIKGESDYYGYDEDLLGRVKASFAQEGFPAGERVHLHQGLFEDTLHPRGPIAVAHVDCDWHDPVMTCLERITPVLSPGGYLVLDDYFAYEGCRRAVDEFLARSDELEEVARPSNLVLRRRR